MPRLEEYFIANGWNYTQAQLYFPAEGHPHIHIVDVKSSDMLKNIPDLPELPKLNCKNMVVSYGGGEGSKEYRSADRSNSVNRWMEVIGTPVAKRNAIINQGEQTFANVNLIFPPPPNQD